MHPCQTQCSAFEASRSGDSAGIFNFLRNYFFESYTPLNTKNETPSAMVEGPFIRGSDLADPVTENTKTSKSARRRPKHPKTHFRHDRGMNCANLPRFFQKIGLQSGCRADLVARERFFEICAPKVRKLEKSIFGPTSRPNRPRTKIFGVLVGLTSKNDIVHRFWCPTGFHGVSGRLKFFSMSLSSFFFQITECRLALFFPLLIIYI